MTTYKTTISLQSKHNNPYILFTDEGMINMYDYLEGYEEGDKLDLSLCAHCGHVHDEVCYEEIQPEHDVIPCHCTHYEPISDVLNSRVYGERLLDRILVYADENYVVKVIKVKDSLTTSNKYLILGENFEDLVVDFDHIVTIF